MSFLKKRKKLPSNFKIQITSMVDMFVILLVFLIKSYSTSPVQINPSNDIRLPASITSTGPVDVLKLMVSKKGIFVEDKKILDFETPGVLAKKDVDPSDQKFITQLFKALDEQAKKTQAISAKNETVKFEGKILMQADRDLEYSLLEKVMHTSSIAGYSEVKLAVLSAE